jgi:hypothetical protein
MTTHTNPTKNTKRLNSMRDTKRLLWNTFRDWWYMPFNLLLTFFIGGFFGWIVVKITTPRDFSGLVI